MQWGVLALQVRSMPSLILRGGTKEEKVSAPVGGDGGDGGDGGLEQASIFNLSTELNCVRALWG